MKKEIDKYQEFLLYKSPDGKVHFEVFIQNETIWLTQQKMADLFGIVKSTISEHIKNIFLTGELLQKATVRKFRTVQKEGNRKVIRDLDFYNLDAIVSVGYRVNSKQATHFRIWATQVLKEYIIKGFAMDDERLKNPQNIFGKDYFEEQLARIYAIFAAAKDVFIKKSQIFMLNAVPIMILKNK